MHPLFAAALRRSGLNSNSIRSKRVWLGHEGRDLGFAYRETRPASRDPRDLEIRYLAGHPLVSFSGSALLKPLLRYDFREEWNNLGYGAIPVDHEDPFGLSDFLSFSGVERIAEIVDRKTGERVCDYAWVCEAGHESWLWFNRAVGPIDGYDWVIVENFFSKHREGERECLPVVSEIPAGFAGACTMRIDCDEAVASGRKLFELYDSFGMPFSMAIKTLQPLGDKDRRLMADVIARGGSVVGHSHTHAPNWGGSREAAAWEVRESQRVLREQGIDGINYDYVVSPFHQNPRSAVEGLRDAGIRGFVGGIICNDPELLLARAGQVPFVEGIVSHSQQCMLHGESFHEAGNSLAAYEQAFTQALETKTFFGFLDHPFSNYWYGWDSEEERLDAHSRYLKFIGSHQGIWKASLVDALRFVDMKASVRVESQGGAHRVTLPYDTRFEGLPGVTVSYAREVETLNLGEEVCFEA